MAQEQTAYVGDDIKVLVNVIGSTGNHVAAVINTTTTRLDGLSAAPTVTTVATGIYQIVFSGVTPAPVEGDRFTCKVNGAIAGVAWSEYGIPVKIVADERGTDNASTHTAANVASLILSEPLYPITNTTLGAISTVDNLSVVSNIENAVLDAIVGNHTVGGSLGATVSLINSRTSSNLLLSADIETNGLAVKAKTDQLAFTVSGQVDANALTGGLSESGVRSAVGLASANLDTQLADIPTVSEFEARTIVASDYFNPSSDTVANVTTVGSVTSAVTTSNASDVTSIKAKTDQFVFTVSNQVDANTLTGGISESGIRSAIGLSSANLDTQLADIPTVSEFEARTLLASAYFDPVNDAVANVTLVGTTTTNSDMRGTENANTVTPDNTSIAAIKTKTDQFAFTIANQVDSNALTVSGGGDATLANQTSIIGMLSGASVVVSQSDLKVGDSVTLRQGMDYNNLDGTAISWTGSISDQWPDLTGSTVTFTAVQGSKIITKTIVVTSPTGTQAFYVEFTAAELSATNAPTGNYRYYITALLSNGRKTTLITDSTLRVAEPYSSGE